MPNNERFRLRYELQMNAAEESADVMIYGEIWDDWLKWSEADVSATDFDKLLKDAKAKGVKNLTIRINSPGGDVNQAIAMRAMLISSGMEEIKISIEGMCASAATLIACLPGAHVTMAEGSEYMIHNPKSSAWGEAKDLEAGAKRLRNTEADSASIYARKSGQSEEQIREWMNAETWMTAKEAHERGFVDAVLDAEPIVASVSNRVMAAMRRMYTHIPESVQEHADTPKVSNAEPTVAALAPVASIGCDGLRAANPADSGGGRPQTSCPSATAYGEVTEHKTHNEEEEITMEIKDVTLEQLQAENPALHSQIMQAGAQQERERIQEIDDLTPAGYEEMAATAKADGTSAMDYHKQIVKAQKQKGADFMNQRKQETAPAAQIAGSSAEEDNRQTEKQELDGFAKEMQSIAASLPHNGINGGMW